MLLIVGILKLFLFRKIVINKYHIHNLIKGYQSIIRLRDKEL
jgi:hypothetical protein